MEHENREDGRRDGDVFMQRVLLEHISRLEHEVEALQGKVEELQRNRYTLTTAVQKHAARLDRLRIDKQIRGMPKWIWEKIVGKPQSDLGLETAAVSPANLLVIAPKYPSEETPYGGQPVERRLSLYRKAGYSPSVFVPVRRGAATSKRFGIDVHRMSLEDLDRVVELTGRSQILVHHPSPEVWDAVKPFVGRLPIHLWIHGYEARDWRDAEFGTPEDEMKEKTPRLDAIGVDRKRALGEAFADDRVTKIFVSEYMQEVATRFVGVEPLNHQVIHNVIDTAMFPYEERREGDRLRVLSIRSFATRTYATDMIRGVIQELAGRDFFGHLHFEVRGDGKFFDEDTGPLARFENVTVVRGIVEGADVARLMARDGVMLIPTRLDTQGITIGEAMSSGMAVVTNATAAIPEFIDQQSGMLSPPEDVVSMADSIQRLYRDPDLFAAISKAAAERVRQQCGPEATVDRELAVIAAAGTGDVVPGEDADLVPAVDLAD